MTKNNSVNFNIISAIKESDNILIVGHMRPDGDCMGSGLALKRVAEKYGKNVDFVCDSEKPRHYDFIKGFETINEPKFDNYNLVIAVDCADIFRLGKFAGYIEKINSINIDHHITNNYYGKQNIVFPDSSSTCEIIFDLLYPLSEIDDYIAYCLFIGLSTDTGHFMHRNTTSKAFETASKLLTFNLDANEITNNIYRTNTINKTKLIERALHSMKFFHNNEVCIISIFVNDIEESGCVFADTEGLTDFAMNIASVKATAVITQQREPIFKISFRSKSVDVAAAAATFGGGGHKLAAGCQISGQYEDVLSKVVKSITDGME